MPNNSTITPSLRPTQLLNQLPLTPNLMPKLNQRPIKKMKPKRTIQRKRLIPKKTRRKPMLHQKLMLPKLMPSQMPIKKLMPSQMPAKKPMKPSQRKVLRKRKRKPELQMILEKISKQLEKRLQVSSPTKLNLNLQVTPPSKNRKIKRSKKLLLRKLVLLLLESHKWLVDLLL